MGHHLVPLIMGFCPYVPRPICCQAISQTIEPLLSAYQVLGIFRHFEHGVRSEEPRKIGIEAINLVAINLVAINLMSFLIFSYFFSRGHLGTIHNYPSNIAYNLVSGL